MSSIGKYIDGVTTDKFDWDEGKGFHESFSEILNFQGTADYDPYVKDQRFMGGRMGYSQSGDTPQERYAGAVNEKLYNLLGGKRRGRTGYQQSTGKPGLSARDSRIGASLLKNIKTRIDPRKHDEFTSMLSDWEGTDPHAYSEETKSWPYHDKAKKMRGFLQENLIPLSEPLELRRIDDKAFDAMVQSATKNDYNVGE
jgi:hypothetical protein|tara:strand:- start:404 stop:997 length:594 start_codon:yes stop_codon:yes gene_type:complete